MSMLGLEGVQRVSSVSMLGLKGVLRESVL